MYSLFELLWVLSPLILLRALHTQTKTWWIVWALVTSLAINTHIFGLLLWGVAGLASGVIIMKAFSWQKLCLWIKAQFIVAAFTLPLVSLVTSTVEKNIVGGTWVPASSDLLKLWLLGLFGFTPVPEQFVWGTNLSLPPWNTISFNTWATLALIITACALWGWFRLHWANKYRQIGGLVLTFGLLPPLVAFFILNSLNLGYWAPRPFIGAVVWLFIGLAVGLSALPRSIIVMILALLFVLNIGPLWAYETMWTKDYTREASYTWSQQMPSGSALVIDKAYTLPIWDYYKSGLENNFIFGLRPVKNAETELRLFNFDEPMYPSQLATCDDLPVDLPIGLYSYGGDVQAVDYWPDCLYGRVVWKFNTETGQWEELPQLVR